MTTDRHTMRPGFTLMEATMALVILGFAAAGVLLPFAGGSSVQVEGTRRTLAANLANDLMEQVITTPFDQIVATWDAYAEAEGEILNESGEVLADPIYAGFSREVNCEYAYMSVPPQGPPFAPNFIFVSVQVRHRSAEIATVSRLLSE